MANGYLISLTLNQSKHRTAAPTRAAMHYVSGKMYLCRTFPVDDAKKVIWEIMVLFCKYLPIPPSACQLLFMLFLHYHDCIHVYSHIYFIWARW